jgi:hypothetical protein
LTCMPHTVLEVHVRLFFIPWLEWYNSTIIIFPF